MSKATIIRRCVLMGILLGIMTVAWPSRADICFLPTRECEQGAKNKRAVVKTCEEYRREGNYFTFVQENMNCNLVNIPGCTLYDCSQLTCSERGFGINGSDNNTSAWPEGYSNSDWECESCKQGNKTQWKCLPRPCDGNYKTSSQCGETETWVAAEGSTHKSGNASCGLCKTVDEMSCPAGTTENPSGCVDCGQVLSIAGGLKKCYACQDMAGYVKESEYSSRYNNSCYEKMSRRAFDGTVCYKPREVSCGFDKYKKEETINGRYTCRCEENEYEFSADEYDLQYSAVGGNDVINIRSKRTGSEIAEWPYEMVSSSGFCNVSEALNKVIVKCAENLSEDAKTHTIKLEQTEEDGEKNYITINITVAADECEIGDLEQVCKNRGCAYETNGTKSFAGQECYDCGECRSGVRATIGRSIVNGINSIRGIFE